MGYREHAEKEFKINGSGIVDKEVLELLDVLTDQGHSGASVYECVRLFSKLALFEPLSPLTGTDDEWVEVAPGVFQNNRCGHVFKENGKAYDLDGIILCEPNGSRYTCKPLSSTRIVFPYSPKSEYVSTSSIRFKIMNIKRKIRQKVQEWHI